MNEEEFKKISDRLVKDYFLIPRRNILYLLGGFFGTLMAIFCIGWAALRTAETQTLVNAIRADANECDRIRSDLASSANDLPNRVSSLEAGSFTFLSQGASPAQDFTFETTEQVRFPLTGIPTRAKQILVRIFLWTGDAPNIPQRTTMFVSLKVTDGELKFPFEVFPHAGEFYAYYTDYIWLPMPIDSNIYTEPSQIIAHGAAGGDLSVIAWK